MAELRIHTKRIQDNIRKLGAYFQEHGKAWSLITKVFSGDEAFLSHVLTPDTIAHIDSVGDSRLTSLKNLRKVDPGMRTIYIKPPAKIYAHEVVQYADISLNTSLDTIIALNEEAIKQNKVHQIIIMIELGELREGIQGDDIIEFYQHVFHLSNIEVIGIGSNLGCMYGVEPTFDKLMQLSLYKALVNSQHGKDLKYISGGSSITLPLLESRDLPTSINHFRVGEAAFFGISPLRGEPFQDLHTDTFEFSANVIELEEKKLVPEGVISDANIGHTTDFSNNNESDTSFKAILDVGLLDVDHENLEAMDPDIHFVGITSDMMVVDLGSNKNVDGTPKYAVGDKISFKPNYMAVARLLNSKFIDHVYLTSSVHEPVG